MQKIKKVLLIIPPRGKDVQSWILPPIGIGYLAAGLKKNNFKVDFLDCIRDNLSLKSILSYIKHSNPDVVGISLYTQDLYSAKELSNSIKKSFPRIKMILGGPHLVCNPTDTMNLIKSADFAFQGEAENFLPLLLKSLNSKKPRLESIPNLIYRKNRKVIVNQREFSDNLDTNGIPDWDLLLKKPYPNTPPTIICKNSNFVPILLTRGCPFSCTYCLASKLHGKKIRKRSLYNVLEEIDLLYNKYRKREFHLVDDNFTLDKDYVLEFCKRIIEKGYKINFASPNGVRLDTLDSEMLKAMKKAGWYLLSVGIESGSDKILKDMKKNLTTKQIKEKIQLIRNFEIEVYGFFIIGYPTESVKDVRKTIKFSKELDLIGAGFSNFHPFIGTEIYEKLVKNDEIKEFDLNRMKSTYAEVVYAPKTIGIKRLKGLHRKAIISFYLRPKIILKILMSIRNLEHFRALLKRGFDYLR